MRRQKLNPAPRRNGSGAALTREDAIKKANSILKKAERLVPSYITGEADETDFWKLRDGIWNLEKKSYGNFTGHDCDPYVTKIMRLYQDADPARRKHRDEVRSSEMQRLRESAYKEQEPYEWMGSTRTFRNPRRPNPADTTQYDLAGGYDSREIRYTGETGHGGLWQFVWTKGSHKGRRGYTSIPPRASVKPKVSANPIMTIQGHTVSRIAGGYRVDAYGKIFATKSACRTWLKGHVAAEKRQLRSRHG